MTPFFSAFQKPLYRSPSNIMTRTCGALRHRIFSLSLPFAGFGRADVALFMHFFSSLLLRRVCRAWLHSSRGLSIQYMGAGLSSRRKPNVTAIISFLCREFLYFKNFVSLPRLAYPNKLSLDSFAILQQS